METKISWFKYFSQKKFCTHFSTFLIFILNVPRKKCDWQIFQGDSNNVAESFLPIIFSIEYKELKGYHYRKKRNLFYTHVNLQHKCALKWNITIPFLIPTFDYICNYCSIYENNHSLLEALKIFKHTKAEEKAFHNPTCIKREFTKDLRKYDTLV